MQQGSIRYEDYHRFIMQCARKGVRRLQAAGCNAVDLEDVQQQMAVTFVMCAERFKPELGYPFLAFFKRALWHNFNRFVEEQVQNIVNPLSFDMPLQEGDGTLSEIIPDTQIVPVDEMIEREQARRRNLNKLSPVARRVVEMIENPPKEVTEQVHALRAKAEFARQRGIVPAPVQDRLSLTHIFDALGIAAGRRHQIYKQLKEVAAL